MSKINDFFPNIEDGGVFTYLSSIFDLPWKNEKYQVKLRN